MRGKLKRTGWNTNFLLDMVRAALQLEQISNAIALTPPPLSCHHSSFSITLVALKHLTINWIICLHTRDRFLTS